MAEGVRATPDAQRPGLRSALAAVRRAVWAPALLTPPLATGLMVLWASQWGVPFNRPVLQLVSVIVLPVAMLIAIVRWVLTRQGYFLWLAGLAAALTCAETHVAGSSVGVYVAMAGLIAVAWVKRAAMATYLAYRSVATLLAVAVVAYFIAESVDRDVWAWLPSEGRLGDAVEETLELVGHCLLTVVAIISRKVH